MKRLIILFLFISALSNAQTEKYTADYEQSAQKELNDKLLKEIITKVMGEPTWKTSHDSLAHKGLSIERKMLLDSLNIAREDPQTYGKRIDLDLSMYPSMEKLIPDNTLIHYAQWYAERLYDAAPVFNHSSMQYEESILWNYDVCVSIDQFVLSDGHREHMLDASNTLIGIGITKGWVGKWYRTYVVILTD